MRPSRRTRALLAVCLAVGWGADLAAQTAPAAQGPPRRPRPGGHPGGALGPVGDARVLQPSDRRAQGAGAGTRPGGTRGRRQTRPRRSGRARNHGTRRMADRSTAAALITVASRGVLALTPPDVDELSGETVEAAAARAAERLQQALDEARGSPHAGRAASRGRCRRGGARAGPAGAVGHRACASSRRPQDRRHRRANGRPNRDRRCRRGPRLATARRGARGRDGAVDRPGSRRDLRHGRLRAATVPLHAALGRIDARVPADDREEPGSWRRGRHPRAVHGADHLLHRAVSRPTDRALVQRDRARDG